MKLSKTLRALAGGAIVFGVLTVLSGGRALFGGAEALATLTAMVAADCGRDGSAAAVLVGCDRGGVEGYTDQGFVGQIVFLRESGVLKQLLF